MDLSLFITVGLIATEAALYIWFVRKFPILMGNPKLQTSATAVAPA